ncbi:MAG: DNA-processing protein DprA [Erysipelotrichales bacterium]|nr:DNA-processing protein DprA [Erysipelotrichales bacterium]
MITADEILLYLSLKYNGDWDKIYEAIKLKKDFSEQEFLSLKTKNKSNYITILNENYPTSLKDCYKPPFVLFYYGDINLLNAKKKITIVGSRNCSQYGELCVLNITKELVQNDYIVVSGMAKGLDSFAHQVALDNGGKTIAVLGTGIDLCYPKQNFGIYKRIQENGLVISEYPTDTTIIKENFPKRNRILAALCEGVFVPEFKANSGTGITISMALNMGKPIFCTPHPIDDETANNNLIKDGAILVENANDIIFELENKN